MMARKFAMSFSRANRKKLRNTLPAKLSVSKTNPYDIKDITKLKLHHFYSSFSWKILTKSLTKQTKVRLCNEPELVCWTSARKSTWSCDQHCPCGNSQHRLHIYWPVEKYSCPAGSGAPRWTSSSRHPPADPAGSGRRGCPSSS